MLGLNQAMGKVKKELMHLQTLRLEARKLKRESQALDLVVNRYVLQCVAVCCIVLGKRECQVLDRAVDRYVLQCVAVCCFVLGKRESQVLDRVVNRYVLQ